MQEWYDWAYRLFRILRVWDFKDYFKHTFNFKIRVQALISISEIAGYSKAQTIDM